MDSQSSEKDSLQELVRQKLTHFLEKSEDYELDNLHSIVLAEVEKPLIELLLKRSRGNQIKTAQMLGINRNTLRKKIQELGISLPPRRSR